MSRVRVNGFLSVKQTVTPDRFLKIVQTNPNSIKESNFIPPVIGRKNDFGKIEIEYQVGTERQSQK